MKYYVIHGEVTQFLAVEGRQIEEYTNKRKAFQACRRLAELQQDLLTEPIRLCNVDEKTGHLIAWYEYSKGEKGKIRKNRIWFGEDCGEINNYLMI